MKVQNNVTVKDQDGNSTKPLLSSRLFKFRAWVRNELMVNVLSIDFNNEFITWDDNQYDRCVPPNKCYEIETFFVIVLMQITGLTDKNGKEIYVGDILYFEDDSTTEKVYFEDGCFGTMGRYNFISLMDTNLNIAKIIGNVFQNPELL